MVVEANGVIMPADQIIFNPKTAGNQALRSLLQTHCTNIMNVVPAVTYDCVFAAATALAFTDDPALQYMKQKSCLSSWVLKNGKKKEMKVKQVKLKAKT